MESLKYRLIQIVVNTTLNIRRSAWFAPTTQPDRVKTYAERSDLYPSRIFLPRSYTANRQTQTEGQKQQQRLPLIICVHGGGFIVNNPALDDPLARHLADHSHSIVVSIDYRKAPQHPFPAAYDDVLQLSLAAIGDTELPLDTSNIVLCGSSAGGNLVLAAAQDGRLRSKLKGVVAFYPVVDFAAEFPAKMESRPDASIPDFLGENYNAVLPLYLGGDNKDVLLTDVRLSPTHFSERKALPANVLLLGCEHDLLCREAEVMAEKLAAMEKGGAARVDSETGWQRGGITWVKVAGQTHGFDMFAARNAEAEKQRVKAREEVFSMLSNWLIRVFGKEDV